MARIKVQMQCMRKHLSRKCCQAFYIYLTSFLYIFIVTFTFNVFSSDLVCFMPGLYFFIFALRRFTFFPRINKAFAISFNVSGMPQGTPLKTPRGTSPAMPWRTPQRTLRATTRLKYQLFFSLNFCRIW